MCRDSSSLLGVVTPEHFTSLSHLELLRSLPPKCEQVLVVSPV